MARAAADTTDPATPGATAVNEVRLSGRLAASPESRELPSGDEVVTFRLIVDRQGSSGTKAPRSGVDTIDCSVWKAGLRRRSMSWQSGDLLVVEGALRRRFWRSPAGPRSRYDVEVTKAHRQRWA